MDILATTLGSAGAVWPYGISANRPASTISSGSGVSSSIPLDPFTGLPLVSPRVAVELVAARALYEWNLQVISALSGRQTLVQAFSATSSTSIEVIQALIGGGSASSGVQSGRGAEYSGGAGGGADILAAILDFFSPAASGLRAADLGIEGAGSAGGARGSLATALAAGTSAAGAGAPSFVLIALHRAESFSLRALDIYGESGSLPQVSALGIDASSETDLLVAYFGSGFNGDTGYSPIDLYA